MNSGNDKKMNRSIQDVLIESLTGSFRQSYIAGG